MLRKVLVVLLALALLSGVAWATSWGVFDGLPIVRLVINGREIAGDVPPVLLHGRTMVPLRMVSENLGAQVSWDQATQTVTVDTAPAESGVPYASWWPSDAEVRDALAWGRTCQSMTMDEVLTPYREEVAPGIEIELRTPYASMLAQTHHDASLGDPARTVSQLKLWFSGQVRVWVRLDTAVPPLTVTLVQGERVCSPSHVFEPWAKEQEFAFDTDLLGLDKTTAMVVLVTINGAEYSAAFLIDDLK